MKFDITDIDKTLLLQALYDYSDPVGLGELEYAIKDFKNIKVSGLPLNEAKEIIKEAKHIPHRNYFDVADYINGKPIKFSYTVNKKQRDIVETSRYDMRNGKYRFFEALLRTFSFEEILIRQKSYPKFLGEIEDSIKLKRSDSQIKIFTSLISNSIRVKDERGINWILDNELNSITDFLY